MSKIEVKGLNKLIDKKIILFKDTIESVDLLFINNEVSKECDTYPIGQTIDHLISIKSSHRSMKPFVRFYALALENNKVIIVLFNKSFNFHLVKRNDCSKKLFEINVNEDGKYKFPTYLSSKIKNRTNYSLNSIFNKHRNTVKDYIKSMPYWHDSKNQIDYLEKINVKVHRYLQQKRERSIEEILN